MAPHSSFPEIRANLSESTELCECIAVKMHETQVSGGLKSFLGAGHYSAGQSLK